MESNSKNTEESLWNTLMSSCGKSIEVPDSDILLLGNKDSGKREFIKEIIKG